MREILFRGKRIDNDEWLYGSFCMDAVEQKNGPCGVDGFIWLYDFAKGKMQMHEVDRETVGQFTGLTDKGGRKAFEHDVIKHHFGDEIGVIRFGVYNNPFGDDGFGGHAGFHVDWVVGTYPQTLRKDLGYWMGMVEIIGNIHDNPELLEGGKEDGK